MQKEFIFIKQDPKQTVWSFLQQVPGLSETSIHKICTLFCIPRNAKVSILSETKLKQLESFILNNFLVGYKLIRQISLAVTARFISRSRRGIRSRQGLPINGQRTHSNGKTPRRLRGHWVLPEVLKNPIAFFNFNKDERKKSQLQELLLKLNNKPMFNMRKLKKSWSNQKTAQRIKIKTKDLSKTDAIKSYNKANRVIYKV